MNKLLTTMLMGGLMSLWCLGCEPAGSDAEAAEEDLSVLATSVGLYQAEAYTAQSGCSKATNRDGYTGSGFVDYGSNGTWIEFNNVNVSAAGTYTLKFRYATASGSRQCAILINGANVGNVAFSSTGSWVNWGTASIAKSLNAGRNTIRIQANTSSGGPNLDSMEVWSENASTGTCVVAAENQTAALSCPSGKTIASVSFASYGLPSGACPGGFTIGSCHAQSSMDKVKAACLGKSSCTVSASNGVFGDPCSGTAKKLAVVYACSGGVVDNCPTDPNKTEPGKCGCGVPEGTCAVVAYYHLRVELSSSSDWAKVVIAKPEHVLRVGTPRITGGGNRVRANLDLIEVNRPSGTVTISADYAVKPVAITGGLQNFFGLLTKGSSGQTTFKVRRIDGACSSLASCPGGVEIGSASAGQRVTQATIQFQSDQGQNVAPKSAEMLPSPPLAWAVYYPWYRDRDPFASNTLEQSIANRGDLRNRVNSYWTNNTSFKDRPTGPSDMGGLGMLSYDPVALRTQVEQAVGAGIDGFLPYYRGTTHFTHGATGLLLDAVSEVNAAQGAGFRVGLHLSPQGAQENAGSGDPVDLLAAWATDFVREYGNHPAVMKIYSKPLAIVYSTGLFEPGDWKRFRERCAGNGIQLFLVADNASATDFDEYIVHFDGAIGRSIDADRGREIGTQLRHNAIFTQERPKLWLGEARPGFDSSDRGEPKDAKYEPRDNGTTLHERFDEAEAIHPQWIRIVSWNEYYEHTHIEPSRDYGSQYLNIVRDRVGSWKKAATFAGASLP